MIKKLLALASMTLQVILCLKNLFYFFQQQAKGYLLIGLAMLPLILLTNFCYTKERYIVCILLGVLAYAVGYILLLKL